MARTVGVEWSADCKVKSSNPTGVPQPSNAVQRNATVMVLFCDAIGRPPSWSVLVRFTRRGEHGLITMEQKVPYHSNRRDGNTIRKGFRKFSFNQVLTYVLRSTKI
jgi:hypothetical protein